ncbi:MAG: adenylate/guanylate cyclase domain-containing protein [Actinobacteria bacterium]|nr:adenylate/guanylate cyclase domain-containing protein [Actinomycetota bacterium]
MSTPQQAFVLPVGTVTFLLTDVAGSTSMWERESAEDMRTAIMRHYEILSEAVDANGGVRPQEQGEGDSIVAAFARPSDAASAAQLALAAERVADDQPGMSADGDPHRQANLRDDASYAGQSIIRTARLRNIGHGGQVLVSGATFATWRWTRPATASSCGPSASTGCAISVAPSMWQLVVRTCPTTSASSPRSTRCPTPCRSRCPVHRSGKPKSQRWPAWWPRNDS